MFSRHTEERLRKDGCDLELTRNTKMEMSESVPLEDKLQEGRDFADCQIYSVRCLTPCRCSVMVNE